MSYVMVCAHKSACITTTLCLKFFTLIVQNTWEDDDPAVMGIVLILYIDHVIVFATVSAKQRAYRSIEETNNEKQ